MGHSNISSSSESLLVLPNRWTSLNSSSHDDEVKVFGTQHSTFTIMETGVCCGSAGKESTCNVGDLSLILGWQDPWKRERLPTPVFWPGESHGHCSPWGLKELDMTERLSLSLHSMVPLASLITQLVKNLPAMWETWV